MKRPSRRRFLGTAGSALAAIGVISTTDAFDGRAAEDSGFEAAAASFVPLLVGDDWLEHALGSTNAGRLIYDELPERTGIVEVHYADPARLASFRDVLPRAVSPESRWFEDDLATQIDAAVTVIRDRTLVTVARVDDGPAFRESLESVDESFTPVDRVDGTDVVARGDGTTAEGIAGDAYVRVQAQGPVYPDQTAAAAEQRRAVGSLLSTRPPAFEPTTADERALRSVLDAIGAPTYVRAGRSLVPGGPPAPSVAPGADVSVPGVEMAGMGFEIGDAWTHLRRVLLGDDLDTREVLAAHHARPSISTYDDLDATPIDDGVRVTGRTRTKFLDFLRPGLPYPRTSFEFVLDSDADTVTVRCTDGPPLPPGRLRLRWWSDDDSDDRWLAAPQWESGDTMVEPGDEMQLGIQDAATYLSLELVWGRQSAEETGWQGLAWIELED